MPSTPEIRYPGSSRNRPIRILIVDDHAAFREGLRSMLETFPEFEVVAEADNGPDAINLTITHKPDVALVDLGMEEMNGIEVTVRMQRHSPLTGVLMLTIYNDREFVYRALRAGAKGYMLKESMRPEVLKDAILRVAEGQHYLSPGVTGEATGI